MKGVNRNLSSDFGEELGLLLGAWLGSSEWPALKVRAAGWSSACWSCVQNSRVHRRSMAWFQKTDVWIHVPSCTSSKTLVWSWSCLETSLWHQPVMIRDDSNCCRQPSLPFALTPNQKRERPRKILSYGDIYTSRLASFDGFLSLAVLLSLFRFEGLESLFGFSESPGMTFERPGDGGLLSHRSGAQKLELCNAHNLLHVLRDQQISTNILHESTWHVPFHIKLVLWNLMSLKAVDFSKLSPISRWPKLWAPIWWKKRRLLW